MFFSVINVFFNFWDIFHAKKKHLSQKKTFITDFGEILVQIWTILAQKKLYQHTIPSLYPMRVLLYRLPLAV